MRVLSAFWTTGSMFLAACTTSSAPSSASLAGQSLSAPPTAKPQALLDAMPRETYMQMISGRALVGSPNLAWRQNVVTVAFNGGSPELYQLIENTATEWTRAGGRLSFSFHDRTGAYRQWTPSDRSSSADIRISFRDDTQVHGYWSILGWLAQSVDPNKATMNYGSFPTDVRPFFGQGVSPYWQNSYYHYTILHEFGHALGLSHEHYHADCQRDLILPNAINYLMGPPNKWDYEPARYSMDAQYYFDAMKDSVAGQNQAARDALFQLSPQIDQASVMLYSFANVRDDYLFRSASRSPCKPTGPIGFATTLSPGDIAAYRSYYAAR